MSFHILVNSTLPGTITAMFDPAWKIHPWSKLQAEDSILQEIEGMLIYGHPTINASLMDQTPRLKVISNFGVGVDHIHLSDAKERGISVGYTPNLLDGATADHTFALLMAIARNIVIGHRYACGPDFTAHDPSILLGSEVHSSTLGIVGLGNIGKQVARRASGFDMRVLYHNRKPDPNAEAALGATYTPLPKLLTESDFVTINVPLTNETRSLIGSKEFAQMKSTAYLINVARGGVVDHNALLYALQNGQIAGAALDVTEPEPLPRDHPLLQQENLILSPHLGSATIQTRQAMARRFIDNLKAGLEGTPLPTQAT